MQNEPNFGKAQMNVNKVLTKDYEEKCGKDLWKNEPKTNPIKANFRKAKMNDVEGSAKTSRGGYSPLRIEPVVGRLFFNRFLHFAMPSIASVEMTCGLFYRARIS
jgi:hypothetical protein